MTYLIISGAAGDVRKSQVEMKDRFD